MRDAKFLGEGSGIGWSKKKSDAASIFDLWDGFRIILELLLDFVQRCSLRYHCSQVGG
jgi:hypothetical protein